MHSGDMNEMDRSTLTEQEKEALLEVMERAKVTAIISVPANELSSLLASCFEQFSCALVSRSSTGKLNLRANQQRVWRGSCRSGPTP